MTMMMMKTNFNPMIILFFCILLNGCAQPFPWFGDSPPEKKPRPAVVWNATDPAVASVAALNAFPAVPASVEAMNSFPAVPLNWTTAEGSLSEKALAAKNAASGKPQAIAPPRRTSSALRGKNTSQFHPMIAKISDEVGVDEDLLHAMIKVESNYQSHAVSHKGARGLLQVMPATGKRFGYSNLMDPEENLRAGATYMKWLIEHFDNDLTLALAGYNAGEGAVRKYGRKVPPYKETRNYVKKVLGHYQQPLAEDKKVARVLPKPPMQAQENITATVETAEMSTKDLTSKLLGLLISRPNNSAQSSHTGLTGEHAVL